MKVVRERTFRPSRALIPFAGGCFLMIIFLLVQMLRTGPLLVVITISPIVVFGLWWFAKLFSFCLRFSVTVNQKGVAIEKPTNAFMDTESFLLSWDEIHTVSFITSSDINPRYFLFHNTLLQFTLKNEKTISVDQIATLDHYTDMFAMIQQVIPFVYEIPAEQMWDERIRIAIVAGIGLAFISLFIVFLL